MPSGTIHGECKLTITILGEPKLTRLSILLLIDPRRQYYYGTFCQMFCSVSLTIFSGNNYVS